MRSLKLLMVEDNALLRQIQMTMISGYGHQVMAAESCDQAVDFLKQHHFDVILMDSVMPEVDGLECTKKIKAMGISIPVVSLSGNNTPESQADCFAAGMSGALSKPTNKVMFEKVMQAVLGE